MTTLTCPPPSQQWLDKYNLELTGEFRIVRIDEITHILNSGTPGSVDEASPPHFIDGQSWNAHKRWIFRQKSTTPVVIREQMYVIQEVGTKHYFKAPGCGIVVHLENAHRYTKADALATQKTFKRVQAPTILVPVDS